MGGNKGSFSVVYTWGWGFPLQSLVIFGPLGCSVEQTTLFVGGIEEKAEMWDDFGLFPFLFFQLCLFSPVLL